MWERLVCSLPPPTEDVSYKSKLYNVHTLALRIAQVVHALEHLFQAAESVDSHQATRRGQRTKGPPDSGWTCQRSCTTLSTVILAIIQ